jgi:hypothetical protein
MSDDLEFEMQMLEQVDFKDSADVETVSSILARGREDIQELRAEQAFQGKVKQSLTDVLANNIPIRDTFNSLPSDSLKQLFIARLTSGIAKSIQGTN